MSSADAPSAAVRTITPPFFGRVLLEDRLQAVALLVLEPPRDAEALAVRDVDDEAAGQRDLGGEPRALRLHRVLDRLDEHVLPALDQVLDLAGALAALELGADDLVDEQEPVLLEADLDERGLHAGQDVVDDAEVDVPGDRPALRPLEVDLGDLVVLEDGDALLAGVDRDEQLALRLRQRRPLRRLRRRAGWDDALARLALGGLLLRGLRSGGLPLARRSSRPRPSVAAPSTGFFFRLRPPRVPRRRFFGGVRVGGARLSVGGRRVRRARRRSAVQRAGALRRARRRRHLFRRLAPEPGQWQTISPEWARAQPRRVVTGARRGWVEKPWHRPSRRVSAVADVLTAAASTRLRGRASFERRVRIARSRCERRAQAQGSTST